MYEQMRGYMQMRGKNTINFISVSPSRACGNQDS